jgi:protocatechuate 3,4-dioxygenase beta subunit
MVLGAEAPGTSAPAARSDRLRRRSGSPTRRDSAGIYAAGLLWLSGCGGNDLTASEDPTGSLTCAVKPELTEGPYYVDENLTRADIRADSATGIAQAGALLALTFNVSRVGGNACTPLPGAIVDVWHCNALGVYSDVQHPGLDTRGQDWLRGNQLTDASGIASFTTVFPGWYQGRATHIHFKIRSPVGADSAYELTSQLFFPESFLTALYTGPEPYAANGDRGRLRNSADGIYNQGGSELLLSPSTTADGYAATLNIGLDLG